MKSEMQILRFYLVGQSIMDMTLNTMHTLIQDIYVCICKKMQSHYRFVCVRYITFHLTFLLKAIIFDPATDRLSRDVHAHCLNLLGVS